MVEDLRMRRVGAFILLVILACLPVIATRTLLATMIQVFIVAVYAMSYDLLLGYTGIVSFGHAMFFGTGAYAVAILCSRSDSPAMLAAGVVLGVAAAATAAVLMGVLSLRVRDVYFSMITLAFAQLVFIGAEKWDAMTGGNDGMSFVIPEILQNRTTVYYVALLFLTTSYAILRRIVNSPFGRTLQAIRENEHRSAALGYPVLKYKVISIVVSSVVASLAGAVYAIFQRFVNTSVLSLDKTVEALLATIIGGAGTLAGPIFGATVLRFVQDWLASLAQIHPIFNRWMVIFGVVYVVTVMFFPKGVLGTIRDHWMVHGKEQAHAAARGKRSLDLL